MDGNLKGDDIESGGFDLTQSEADIGESTQAEKQAEQGTKDQEKAISGELITAGETKKRASRAVVVILEMIFKVKHSGIKYGDNVYDDAERELGPAIEKHSMAGRGLFSYFEEILALKFFFGTIAESIRWIREQRDDEAKAEAKGGDDAT